MYKKYSADKIHDVELLIKNINILFFGEIKKGEQLTIDYGEKYDWNKKTPKKVSPSIISK